MTSTICKTAGFHRHAGRCAHVRFLATVHQGLQQYSNWIVKIWIILDFATKVVSVLHHSILLSQSTFPEGLAVTNTLDSNYSHNNDRDGRNRPKNSDSHWQHLHCPAGQGECSLRSGSHRHRSTERLGWRCITYTRWWCHYAAISDLLNLIINWCKGENTSLIHWAIRSLNSMRCGDCSGRSHRCGNGSRQHLTTCDGEVESMIWKCIREA